VTRRKSGEKTTKEDSTVSNSRKDVYTIIRNGEKAFWQKVGRAHVNKDGSLNVYLNALPLNGELNIREPRAKSEAREN
jgi:hypothetical protein